MLDQHFLFLDEAEQTAQPRQHMVLPPPKVEPLHEVFAEAMLEESSTHQRRSPLDWVVSLLVHVAILAVLLILPLYFTSGINVQKMNLTFLATPLAPAAAPPPAPMTASAAPRSIRPSPVRTYVPGKLTAPSFIPKVVAAAPGDASAPIELTTGIPGGVPGGIPGGQIGGVLGGVLGALRISPRQRPLWLRGPKHRSRLEVA